MSNDSFALAALAVVASGYIIYDAPICRFFWARQTGYVLYLRTITVGLMWLFLCVLFYSFLPDRLLPLFQNTFLHERYWPIFILVAAILVRCIVWIVSMPLKPEWKHVLQLKKLEHCKFDKFIYESMGEGNLVQITLENNKVYIGLPSEIDPDGNEKWLHLIPCYSGHRDKKRNLNITINYFETFLSIDSADKPNDQLNRDDLEEKIRQVGEKIKKTHKILVPVEKIISSQSLDPGVFEKLNQSQLKKIEAG